MTYWTWIAILAATLLGGISGAACRTTPPPPPAGVDCTAACTRLSDLSCEDGKPTPAGVPCATWLCATPMSSGRTACIAHAADCDAARACKGAP